MAEDHNDLARTAADILLAGLPKPSTEVAGTMAMLNEVLSIPVPRIIDTTPAFTVAAVREVFRKIAAGERRHGSFLTTFAQAMMLADDCNELVMQSAAHQLISKYNLESYAEPVGKDEVWA